MNNDYIKLCYYGHGTDHVIENTKLFIIIAIIFPVDYRLIHMYFRLLTQQ